MIFINSFFLYCLTLIQHPTTVKRFIQILSKNSYIHTEVVIYQSKLNQGMISISKMYECINIIVIDFELCKISLVANDYLVDLDKYAFTSCHLSQSVIFCVDLDLVRFYRIHFLILTDHWVETNVMFVWSLILIELYGDLKVLCLIFDQIVCSYCWVV